MNKFRFPLYAPAVALLTFACVSTAHAQATRTWVSGVGDDANPCSRTAPCKTYAGAISKTAKDGEISTLDPGGFGAVTITKSITINGGGAGGGFGSILAAATTGIIINITAAADIRKTVRLNWLDINGVSTGINGINFIAGNALHVENTNIDGFTSNGIQANLSGNASLFLRNVVIRNCTGSGLNISAAGANSVSIGFEMIQVSRCGTGITAGNGTRGSIRSTALMLNGTGLTTSQAGSPTEVNIDGSLFTGSATGINTGAGTRVRISRSLISQNANALGLGGTVDTGVNNTIMGNTVNQDPNGTGFPEK